MKTTQRQISIILTLAMTTAVFSNVLASYQAESAPVHKLLNITDYAEWSFETSGAVESITTLADGWMMQAGGEEAYTHYARVKYKLPERSGVVFTYFYAKAVIVLPDDFYTQQKSGLRILNTDNYQTTLNGVPVGALGADELRVSVYIMNSDHKLRVFVDHQNGIQLKLYEAPDILPTGEHTFELSGDVANAAPWYLRVDGVTVASGIQRLSTDDIADSERVITRIVAGIDGAANQDLNPMSVIVKSVEIANYDVTSPTPTPSPTVAPSQNIVNIRIANGKNDVEENSRGKVYINGDDLELVYDGGLQTVGLRFTGVKIPSGARIVNAYIQFKADEKSSQAVSLKIRGEASANAPAFTSAARNVSARHKTIKAITWSPRAWLNVGALGKNQTTPNLASVIQEIVNLPGWTSGNALVMIVTGNAGKRVAESFEGDATGSPLLHVEYK